MNSKNMRKKIALGTLTAMLVMGSGVASANSINWSAAFLRFVLTNRCVDAGPGNGGERFTLRAPTMCRDNPARGERVDSDPGNSRSNNQAPNQPPGNP